MSGVVSGGERDEVTSFVRRLRRSTAEAATDLRLLMTPSAGRSRAGSAGGKPSLALVADRADDPTQGAELTAIVEELAAQIEQSGRACALLERERAKYVDLFLRAPDAYVTTDSHGNIGEANVAAGRLLRVPPENLPGRALIGFIARRDTVSFREFLRALQRSQPEDGPREVLARVRPRGQQPLMMAVRAYPLFSERARPIVFRWILRKVELGDVRVDADARLGWVVRTLVEDMVVPVERAGAWAERIRRDDFVDAQDRSQCREWVEQSVEQLGRLRSDLEELAASCELPGVDGLERVDLAVESLHIVDRVRSRGKRPRVELTGLRPGDALEVLANRAMLGRALEILVGRAIAGTPVDRVVTVRADCQGNAAILEVGSDAGRAPQRVEHPFCDRRPHRRVPHGPSDPRPRGRRSAFVSLPLAPW